MLLAVSVLLWRGHRHCIESILNKRTGLFMGEGRKLLEDNPKDAAEVYLRYLWSGYYKWYENAVRRNQQLWLVLQIVAVGAGFGTAVIATLVTSKGLEGSSLCRISLVILPLIGTLAGTIAANSKVASRWALREQGRQAVQSLVDAGRQRFAAATTAADYSTLHESLVRAIAAIEAAQAEGCFPLLPDLAKLPAANKSTE